MFKDIYTHSITIDEMKTMNLKESEEEYIGTFGSRK